jgi:hypothetical protein
LRNLHIRSIYAVLLASHHPADQDPAGERQGANCRYGEDGLPLHESGAVFKKFLGSIAALFGGTPHGSDTLIDRISRGAGCTRSLVDRVRNVFSGSFQYCL